MKQKRKNMTISIRKREITKLEKIAAREGCVALRGVKAGTPSVNVLIREIASGRIRVVSKAAEDMTEAPEWWPIGDDGSPMLVVHRRRLTVEQEIWCARRLAESNDGLGFYAADHWVAVEEEESPAEELAGARPDWWPEGEALSPERLAKHVLPMGMTVDDFMAENPVTWNDAGWAEWKGGSGE